MNSQQAAKQYQRIDAQSNINEASPHQLISMLIDGALARLAAAKGCIERGDREGKGIQMGKSMDIITGLQSSLDMDAGGEVSLNLDQLYDYMIRCLAEASAENGTTKVDEVISLLREIKAGWDGIPKEFHTLSSGTGATPQAVATP